MKIKYVYLLLIALLTGGLTFTAFMQKPMAGTEQLSVRNKIKFNHALHKESVECIACHSGIQTSTSLSEGLYPKKEDCTSCHDVADDKNCTQCHFEDKFEALQPAAYPVIFNHKKHLTNRKQCTDCHAGIETDDGSDLSVHFNPTMSSCAVCHNDTKDATNACAACHISTVNLIPKNHQVNEFPLRHKFQAAAPNANCMMCHDNSSCDDCHSATSVIYERNTKNDFRHPYSGTQFVDGTKAQQITRVHDLNFRFSHGIEAKGKERDCGTCHQAETFCAECHGSSNEDFAAAGVTPYSHRKNGFVTFGVGSGGGMHGTLAKRDIEQCIACHDTQGSDPVCINCHVDADGIRGTDPKTHKTGAMKSIEDGDWHSSSSSLCFNCHTDANARPSGISGIGFCGYCHGKKQ